LGATTLGAVPFTLFAHQVPAVGLKVARPKWFDGTALAIGSMAPDLGYAVSGRIGVDTHDWDGLVQVVFPLALLFTLAARWVVADVAPAHMPDLGPVRLRSWRVTARRQPAWWITIPSCVVGIATHVVLDAFTHPGRFGVRALGYDDVVVHAFGRSEPLAGVFQLVGHTFGSLLGLWLLVELGRRRLLEDWYGEEAVRAARAVEVTRVGTVVFWSTVVAGTAIGMAAGWGTGRLVEIVRTMVGCGMGAIVGSLLPICRPRPLSTAAPEDSCALVTSGS
jgi:hypothetical protein